MHFDAILFDFDGTLADSARFTLDAFNHVAVKYFGRPYTIEELKPHFGPSEETTWRSILPREVAEQGLRDYFDYYQREQARIQIFEDIPEVLKKLNHRNIPLGVVTSRGRKTMEISLEHFKLHDIFQAVITSDDVKNHKPDPEPILLGCQRLGVSPEKCLMVGDTQADVLAGRAAGTKTAAVFWGPFGIDGRLEDAGADWHFHKVRQLEEFLLGE